MFCFLYKNFIKGLLLFVCNIIILFFYKLIIKQINSIDIVLLSVITLMSFLYFYYKKELGSLDKMYLLCYNTAYLESYIYKTMFVTYVNILWYDLIFCLFCYLSNLLYGKDLFSLFFFIQCLFCLMLLSKQNIIVIVLLLLPMSMLFLLGQMEMIIYISLMINMYLIFFFPFLFIYFYFYRI